MESVIDELRRYHKRQSELLAAYPKANMTVNSAKEHERNGRLLAEIDSLVAPNNEVLDKYESILDNVRQELTYDGGAGYNHGLVCEYDEVIADIFGRLRAARTATPVPSLLVGSERPTEWVIVSMKPGRGAPYWRPNSAGYTDSVTDAGKYSYDEAASIVAGCHGDDEKYCIDDPALLELISYHGMVRGKELRLWVENARLRAASGDSSPGGEAQTLASWNAESLEELAKWAKIGDCAAIRARLSQMLEPHYEQVRKEANHE